MDSSGAHRDLGWNPQLTFEEGVDRTIAWVARNSDELSGLPWAYQHKP